MSNQKSIRPFGVEFLEPIIMPARGADMEAATCCTTWDSTINYYTDENGNPTSNDEGDPTDTFCNDSDRCHQEET